jgi:hypothetical protein
MLHYATDNWRISHIKTIALVRDQRMSKEYLDILSIDVASSLVNTNLSKYWFSYDLQLSLH